MDTTKPSEYKNINSSSHEKPEIEEHEQEHEQEQEQEQEQDHDEEQEQEPEVGEFYVITKNNKPFKVFRDLEKCKRFSYNYILTHRDLNMGIDYEVDVVKGDNSVSLLSKNNYYVYSYDCELMNLTWYKV